jgi:phosphohistidine phosphatase
MKLYILRHGESLESTINPNRPLSVRGRNTIENLSKFLGTSNLSVSRILHSGILRAKETAEIVAKHIHCNTLPKAYPEIKPLDDPYEIILNIETLLSDTLIVSHLPFVDRLLTTLLILDESRPMVSFEPGTLVCLERVKEKIWSICFILTPFLFSS